MFKKIILLIGIILLSSSCHIQANANSLASGSSAITVIKHLQKSTVTLVKQQCNEDNTKCSDTYSVYCGGVWISKQHFLTAHHCVQSYITSMSTEEEIDNNEDEKLVNKKILFVQKSIVPDRLVDGRIELSSAAEGIVLGFDAKNDLALIKTQKHNSAEAIVNISQDTLRVGEEVHVVGHTVGIPYTYANGYLAGIRDDNLGQGMISVLQISAPLYFGNSGGGVYNQKGELIGICSYLYMRMPTHLNFFIHRDTLISFTSKYINLNLR
tara:strand:+ start:234 stop:1037 length:804 start_codon:yes stop_codon:yes gene_type:complete